MALLDTNDFAGQASVLLKLLNQQKLTDESSRQNRLLLHELISHDLGSRDVILLIGITALSRGRRKNRKQVYRNSTKKALAQIKAASKF